MIYYHTRKTVGKLILYIENASITISPTDDKDRAGFPACICYVKAGKRLGFEMYDIDGNPISDAAKAACIALITNKKPHIFYKKQLFY